MPSLSVVHAWPSRARKVAPALSSPPKPSVPSTRPGTNHLKPTGTSRTSRPSARRDAVDERARHQRLADRGARRPAGAVGVEVVDGDGQIVVGVHQPRARRDDAVAIGVGVVPERDGETIAQREQAGHRVGAGAVHPDLAVVVERHEREPRVDGLVDHLEIQAEALGDAGPVLDAGAAHRVGAELDAAARDRVDVDDLGQILDVGGQEIVDPRRGRGCAPGRRRRAARARCRRAARWRAPRWRW